MASVKPFRALRYNSALVNNSQTVAPPYDVINAEQQEALHNRDEHNIIRLELGKKFAEDNDNDNRYTRASATFKQWQQEEILVQDDKPAYYLYIQEYQHNGQAVRRKGFFATIKAEGYGPGNVLPHEETLPKHKADRLALMEHTFANFSPIFGLFNDPEKKVDQLLTAAAGNPVIDFSDEAGVHHIMYVINDETTCAAVEAALADKNVYIADGHHRYETASRFNKECLAQGITGCDRMLMAFVNLHDEGLLVFPTHRLIKSMGKYCVRTLLGDLEKNGFSLEQIDDFAEAKAQMNAGGKQTPSFLLHLPQKNYLLRLQNKDAAIASVASGKSLAYRSLDVTLLHDLIIQPFFGIGPAELAAEGYLAYTRNDNEALDFVDNGAYACSFLMNSTLVSELLAVAEAGEKMPQKSTYFYPKFISGLVINKLR